MVFASDFLVVGTNGIISMRFIEGITITDGEDLTADKLRGDLNMEISMISGKCHIISVNNQRQDGYKNASVSDLARSIIDKWQYIISKG